MVRRRQRERSVWEVILPDADKLWPAALRRLDQLIDDETLVEVIAVALERRWAQSRRRGRPGTPAEVVLRMLVLKHLSRWRYAQLEQEVRGGAGRRQRRGQVLGRAAGRAQRRGLSRGARAQREPRDGGDGQGGELA